MNRYPRPAWLRAAVLGGLWLTVSEFARYLLLVRPRTIRYFTGVKGVAPMNVPVVAIWLIWGTLLLGCCMAVYWLFSAVRGPGRDTILLASSLMFSSLFALFWIAAVNMGLGTWSTAGLALPWAFGELVVLFWIVEQYLERFTSTSQLGGPVNRSKVVA